MDDATSWSEGRRACGVVLVAFVIFVSSLSQLADNSQVLGLECVLWDLFWGAEEALETTFSVLQGKTMYL